MDEHQTTTVKSVFGRDFDISEFAGVDVREILGHVDQLKLEDTDPQYQYGWLDTGDPNTKIKINKGIWEAVKADEMGGTKVPGLTDSSDGLVHVRELVLVRMPKEKWERIQKAYALLSLRKESAVAQQFMDQTQNLGKKIVPDADPAGFVKKDEKVRVERGKSFGT